MDDSSNLKLRLLDELCDKLDECGIKGNVIKRTSIGTPSHVNIWYGDFDDYALRLDEMFTVEVTDNSLYINPNGCYEIKPPNKYCDYFNDIFKARRSPTAGFYIMGSDLIIRTIKFLFDREKWERKRRRKWLITQ